MVSIVEYTLILIVVNNYLNKKPIFFVPGRSLRLVGGTGLALVAALLILNPSYLIALVDTISNLLGFLSGDIASETADDDRISLTKQSSMFKAFTDNLFTGTGYDERWFNNVSRDDHWEGADYIFLGVLGQFGIIGSAIFLIYYILIYSIIFRGYALLRRNWKEYRSQKKIYYPYILLFLAGSVEYIRNLVEYPNWFVPISASSFGYLFFIYGGMIVGSFYGIQNAQRRAASMNMKRKLKLA
jgi:hypothetical protein